MSEMEEQLKNVKFFGGFSVTADGVRIKAPDGYPAIYGGTIFYPSGEKEIVDFVFVKDEEQYDELVAYLNEVYAEIYGNVAEETSESELEDVERILDEVSEMVEKERRKADVPVEYRRYIRREDIPKLPKSTRVHRGPRGGLFIDVREVPEHVHERLERREEERKPQTQREGRREKAVAAYEGKLAESLKYKLEVNKERGEAKIRFERGGNVLEFSADLKSRSIKVTDISFSEEPEGLIRELEDYWFVRGLFENYPKSETYRYVTHPESLRTLSSLDRIREGARYSATDLNLVSKGYEENRELLDRPLSYWEQVSSEDSFKFYYSEGIESLEQHKRSVDLFKKIIRNKFGGSIVFLPSGSVKAGGLFDSDKMTILVCTDDVSAMFHEYFHYIFDFYGKLYNLKDTVELTFGYFVNGLFEEETESGGRIGLVDFADYATGKDMPKELKQVGDLWKEFLGKNFMAELGKALLEYFASLPTEKAVGWRKYVKEVANRLDRLINYFGGKEVLSKFEELARFLYFHGGLTPYSQSWKEIDPRLAATEAFASVGDFIGYYVKLSEYRGGLSVVKLTRDTLMSFYEKAALEKPTHILQFLKGKEGVLAKVLDFLDTIGLIRWVE